MSKVDDPRNFEMLRRALPHAKDRARTLVELMQAVSFLFAPEIRIADEKALKVIEKSSLAFAERGTSFAAYLDHLAEVDDAAWNASVLKDASAAFAAQWNLKLGDIAQPVRVATTGSTVSFGSFEIMEVLGRATALARLRRALVPA